MSEGDADQARFRAELEFVQCLANPQYIHCRSLVDLVLFDRSQTWPKADISTTPDSRTTLPICSTGSSPSMLRS
jgi:hypothetical protein